LLARAATAPGQVRRLDAVGRIQVLWLLLRHLAFVSSISSATFLISS
jgi:hypothetical protein